MQDNSIYEPPKSEIETYQTEPAEIVTASRWARFFNYLIDYVGMIILVVILLALTGIILGEDALNSVERIPDFVLGIVLTLLYYLPLEYLTGRTLGKLVTGTKVVAQDGSRPTFSQVLGRTFSRIVPFEPLSFIGSEGRGWHDTWPKTYVIKCR